MPKGKKKAELQKKKPLSLNRRSRLKKSIDTLRNNIYTIKDSHKYWYGSESDKSYLETRILDIRNRIKDKESEFGINNV